MIFREMLLCCGFVSLYLLLQPLRRTAILSICRELDAPSLYVLLVTAIQMCFIHLCLVLEIFPYLPRGEVPHLNETVGTPGDQVLTVWGEYCTFRVRLGAKLYRPVE